MNISIGVRAFQTVIIILYHFLSATVPPDKNPHQDLGLNIIDVVNKYGYILEEHKITTEDGYIIKIFRIPNGRKNNDGRAKPAVLVMHGLLLSAMDWVNTGAERGLGYVLAERGYDVWLGNTRGNTWGRNHTTLGINDPQFWDYSFHEIGVYDIPAQIDYITRQTRQSKIYYIGHSQGATSFFVMASERPEYNNKIRLMSALASVTYPSKMLNIPFRTIAMFQKQAEWGCRTVGLHQLLPHNKIFANVSNMACREGSPYQPICQTILWSLGGFNYKEYDTVLYPVILSNMPAGAAIKQLFHYTQMINSDRFEQFDHGTTNNIIRYGQKNPPQYDLSKVTAPVAFYYSENDWLSSVYDVNRLAGTIPNTVLKYKMPDKKFNHWDYMWAKQVVSKLYNPMTKFMLQF